MKTKTPIAAVLMIAWLLTLTNASAYYDPGAQRWINRDPIQENGGINIYVFANNSPRGFLDAYGLAYICERPMQSWNNTAKLAGHYPFHVQIFFEDYDKQKADPKKYPANLGLFDDDKVRPDDVEKKKPKLFKKYQKKSGGFDDAVMREALDNVVKKRGTDWKVERNCQHFVDEVLEEYFKLQKQRRGQKTPATPQPNPESPQK